MDLLDYAGIACLYLLPWLSAVLRGHHNHLPILALNLVLGWTVLGWIVALVWSASGGRHLPALAPQESVEEQRWRFGRQS